MIDYNIEERFHRYVGHGSLGMTNKYYKDGYWYKQNLKGYEGKSEAICSKLLEYSNIEDFVQYEECQINGVPGCRSRNMVTEHESVVTLSRLYEYAYGGSLTEKVKSYGKLNDRIEYVLDFVYESTKLDLYEYMGKVLKFDMLTYDVDRHFNNLAVIRVDDGSYRAAPLFDFGASFFSMKHIFTDEMSLDEKIKKMTPQPFAGSFEEQAAFFDKVSIYLDKEGALAALADEPAEILEMLEYNLERYKDEFLDICEMPKKVIPEIKLI